MSSQRFCLRWNNHQSNLLSVFDQLLHAETFTDVTLAVEGQLLKAHKMVLSACSPYFQALFLNHQEKHPIVILKDVPYSDMKSLLDFMYRGEVSVDQERLTAFLRVAESLRIKGLTEVNEEKCDIPALTNSLLQQQQPNVPTHTPPPQLHRIHPYMQQKRPGSGTTGGAPPNLLMPLLGNALLQPKRKRGRPRKLSGSSSDALNAAASPPGDAVPEAAAHTASNRIGEQLLRGSPEMLEVKMSMDGFPPDDGATSGGEDTGEALLIDEGDDAPHTPTPSKDSESAGNEVPLFLDYHGLTYEEEAPVDSMPIITLEVMSNNTPCFETHTSKKRKRCSSTDVTLKQFYEENTDPLMLDNSPEVHYLTDEPINPNLSPKVEPQLSESEDNERADCGLYEVANTDLSSSSKSKNDLLEYMTRHDGSVVCKLCGEVLQSRTHWYRHKYKFHVMQNMNPAPLYQCEQCLVFFKSRKGYIGHIASRHSENTTPSMETQTYPTVSLSSATSTIKSPTYTPEGLIQIKEEPIDPELSIPKSTVPNYNTNPTNKVPTKTHAEPRKVSRNSRAEVTNRGPDWEERRSREEKLVADIIDRVRRECEAQGGATRRGYTRRTTVMNT